MICVRSLLEDGVRSGERDRGRAVSRIIHEACDMCPFGVIGSGCLFHDCLRPGVCLCWT